MDRVITVTGAGTATARPDQVRIDGTLSGVTQDYASAVRASAESVSVLRRAVGEAGFDMDMLKTTGLSVNAVYRHDKEDRRVFEGFAYSHGVRMTADAGEEGLGKLLEAIMGCEGAPEFHVSYVVSDPSVPMAEARRNAVADARARAEDLAAAAGLTLGEIVTISYVSSPCNIATPRMRMMSASMLDGVVPEDAEFSDSVTVEWRILR